LLKIPSPGRDDSFFDLGAHSILAALFLTMAGRKFGIRLQPRSIFQRPKLQDFADFIDEQILLQRRAQSESGTAA
jgi:tyrocidine synthetase-3